MHVLAGWPPHATPPAREHVAESGLQISSAKVMPAAGTVGSCECRLGETHACFFPQFISQYAHTAWSRQKVHALQGQGHSVTCGGIGGPNQVDC